MRKPLIERLHPHGPDAFSDQVADRIVHHGGGNSGAQSKTVGQVRGAIVLAPADMNLALRGFSKWNHSRIKPVHERTERQKIQRPIRAYGERVCHDRSPIVALRLPPDYSKLLPDGFRKAKWR